MFMFAQGHTEFIILKQLSSLTIALSSLGVGSYISSSFILIAVGVCV